MPTWPQLGPQVGSQDDQKSIQEASKIDLNLHLVLHLFLAHFLIDFGANIPPTWTPKPPQNDVMLAPKTIIFLYSLEYAEVTKNL